jgi:hypothetical protein
MKTGIHHIQSKKGVLFVEVDYSEYANIENGQMRALMLAGAVTGVSHDAVDTKPITVRCLTSSALDGKTKPLYSIDCIIKGVFPIKVNALSTPFRTGVLLVSIQPVAHRFKEINRRKAYRSLHRAYERLRARLHNVPEEKT